MTKIPISLYAEATPNPSVMKFTANKLLVDNNIYEFLNRAEAISSPLALELFGFPFVESVFISGNFVSVTKKHNNIEWSDIVLEMREFIRDFIADGGKVINEDAPVKLKKDSIKHKEELKRVIHEAKELEIERRKTLKELQYGSSNPHDAAMRHLKELKELVDFINDDNFKISSEEKNDLSKEIMKDLKKAIKISGQYSVTQIREMETALS